MIKVWSKTIEMKTITIACEVLSAATVTVREEYKSNALNNIRPSMKHVSEMVKGMR